MIGTVVTLSKSALSKLHGTGRLKPLLRPVLFKGGVQREVKHLHDHGIEDAGEENDRHVGRHRGNIRAGKRKQADGVDAAAQLCAEEGGYNRMEGELSDPHGQPFLGIYIL